MQNEITESGQSVRMGRGYGRGPGGNCVCPSCGHKEAHQPGMPCSQKQCPECKTRMVRE